MVIEVLGGPELWLKLEMVGGGVTVKNPPLIGNGAPATVTTTLPLVAPLGTATRMLVSLQLAGVAAVPLKATVLAPWAIPKLVPVIVTFVPIAPEFGLRFEIEGRTVKLRPLLAIPPTVTTTVPVVAPGGTDATMLVALKFDGIVAVPLKLTEIAARAFPKFAPVIVIGVPTGPDAGFRLVMLGGGITAKTAPLLAMPPTVTTTFPVAAPMGTGATMFVALQLVGVTTVPLNATVLVPCTGPKFAPLIATGAPIIPDVGFRLVMVGIGWVTVIVAVPVFVLSATEVAVSVTVGGLGTMDGAV